LVIRCTDIGDILGLAAALAALVPYTGATGPVDLNGQDLSNVSAFTATNSVLAPNIYVGTGSPTGHLYQDVGTGNFDIVYYGSTPFVGWNATSSTPYFGNDPTVYGYGVSYSGNILYVTASGGYGARTLQSDGGVAINGDSGNYIQPLLITDLCSLEDGSTSSFTVDLPVPGVSALDVKNNGDIFFSNSTYQFYGSGYGYIGAGIAWDTNGRFRVGGGDPTYAYLESVGTSYTQLLLGYDNSIYTQFNVDAAGGMTIRPASNNTGVLKVANSAGTAIFTVDSTNDRLIGALGANSILFAKGGSNVTPNLSIGASGGKAVALLAGTSGSAFLYDSTGTFAIATDTRANIVGGSSSGGTQRIGMTSAGLVMVGAGTATARLHLLETTANSNILILANSDATFGNSYTFKVSNGTGGGQQKNLVITGGNSSNDAVLFENTMGVYMGTTVGTNNGVYIGDNNNTNQIPKALLHVGMDTATMPTIDANTGFILSNASATGDSASASIIAGATGFSVLNFGDTADENVGYIQYAHSTNTMSFGANTNPMLYINGTVVGIGVAANDTLTVGSPTNGTNITMGFRTLTSGGSSMRSIFTQEATTGQLSLVVDQGQNGSARAFNLTVGGATNAVHVTSVGDVIFGASAASGNKFSVLKTSTTVANILVQDLGTGDAAMAYNVSGSSYSLGIDQSDSSKFKLSNSTTLGTSDIFTIVGSTGAITLKTSASIGSSSAKQIFNASTATTVIDYDVNASSAANNTFIRLGNGTLTTASSGVTNIISSTPSINQSGTAGYTAFNINVTETATGSGAKNLLRLAVGGTERFSVSNVGIAVFGAQARLKGYTVATLPAGTQGDLAFVTDALAPSYNTAVVGGGAVVTKVFYNGTAWVAA